MYLDDIRAYRPADEQEEADQRMMLEYAPSLPETILTQEERDRPFYQLRLCGERRRLPGAYGPSQYLPGVGLDRRPCRRGERPPLGGPAGGPGGDRCDPSAPLSADIMSLDILPVWGHVKRGRYVTAHQHLNVSYLLVADEMDSLSVREERTPGWPGSRRTGCWSIPMSGRWTVCIPSFSGGPGSCWVGCDWLFLQKVLGKIAGNVYTIASTHAAKEAI